MNGLRKNTCVPLYLNCVLFFTTVIILLSVHCVSTAGSAQEHIILRERNIKTDEPCSNREYQRCMKVLNLFGHDNMSPKNISELNVLCKRWRIAVQCVDTHQHTCFSSQQRQLFNQVVSGARDLLTDICLPGPTQEEYLRHVACNEKITNDMNKCGAVYRHLIRLGQTTSDSQSSSHAKSPAPEENAKRVEKALTSFCCKFSEFVTCVNSHVREECGANATSFFERHLQRLSSGFVEEQCTSYLHGSSACSAGNFIYHNSFGILFLLTCSALVMLTQ